MTAKHLTTGLKDKDKVDVFKNGEWTTLTMDVFRCDGSVDIAVLIPPEQLTVSFPLEPTIAGLRFAQDVYFAGFPYGTYFTEARNLSFYPFPFLKKGIISGNGKDPSGEDVLFLDGHNNPGFSGGPIVYRDVDHMESWVFKKPGSACVRLLP